MCMCGGRRSVRVGVLARACLVVCRQGVCAVWCKRRTEKVQDYSERVITHTDKSSVVVKVNTIASVKPHDLALARLMQRTVRTYTHTHTHTHTTHNTHTTQQHSNTREQRQQYTLRSTPLTSTYTLHTENTYYTLHDSKYTVRTPHQHYNLLATQRPIDFSLTVRTRYHTVQGEVQSTRDTQQTQCTEHSRHLNSTHNITVHTTQTRHTTDSTSQQTHYTTQQVAHCPLPV